MGEHAIQNNTKIERKKEDTKFPLFMCPNCRVKVQLDFDPLKCPLEWHLFKCHTCGWHNRDDDYVVIQKIKLTFIIEETQI